LDAGSSCGTSAEQASELGCCGRDRRSHWRGRSRRHTPVLDHVVATEHEIPRRVQSREYLSALDAVRLDNGLLQHQSGFLDDDYVAYIRKSIRLLAPYWDQIGLFELSSFRQGFIDEVRHIRAADD